VAAVCGNQDRLGSYDPTPLPPREVERHHVARREIALPPREAAVRGEIDRGLPRLPAPQGPAVGRIREAHAQETRRRRDPDAAPPLAPIRRAQQMAVFLKGEEMKRIGCR
jgi:hypothetical protein